MAGRITKGGIREVHGDAEIIELEDGSPTGRVFTVKRPDPLAGWPWWLRAMAIPVLLVWIVFLLVALGACIWGTVFFLGVLFGH